jgi:flagellar basal-body rod protein FlgG
VDTPGFKRLFLKEMSQRINTKRGDAEDLFVFPRFEDSPVVLEQGVLKNTQRNLDFAIEGDGFFVVQNNNKEKFLTRNGHFFVNSEGYLVTQNGERVLDEQDGEILLDGLKKVVVGEDGGIYQENEQVAKLKIVSYKKVEAIGNSLYKGLGKEEKEFEYKVKEGFLENSNINIIKEMSNLILSQRRFEIYLNLIKSLDAVEQKSHEIGKA